MMIDKNKGCERKGQAALEMITLLGFIMLFSIPLIVLVTSLNDADLAIKQGHANVQLMTDAANSVYIMGCNSSREILISYPSKLNNITIASREIIFKMDTGYGPMDVVGKTIAPLDNSSKLIENGSIVGGIVLPGARKINVHWTSCVSGAGKIRFDLS